MKYLINIQSISDLITNSSSETFCKIIADKDILRVIEDLLSPAFGSEYELEAVLEMRYKDDVDPEYCSNYDKLPEQWIEINLPYTFRDIETFFKKGLEAVLDDYFEGEYKIIYENN